MLWRYPEWWSLALSGAAWVVLVGREVTALSGHHVPGGVGAWLQDLCTWLLMVLAMMVPLVVFSIRVTAARSLWRRRDRAIGGFLIGYLSAWLLVGPAIVLVDVTFEGQRWLGALGFGIAAVWQLAPARQRAARACHRTIPLAPNGWRADRDCFHFGWLTGCQCLISCWALMAASVLVGHGLAAMAFAAAIGAADRYLVRTRRRTMFSPLLGVALVYAILGIAALT